MLGILWGLAVLSAALAGEKAVTPRDAAATPVVAGPASIVWSRDGAKFAWKERDRIWIAAVPSGNRRELLALSALKDAAVDAPEPSRFGWVNRGVREQPVQWFPDGQRLLLAVDGDLFVVTEADGKWEQLTKTERIEADPKLSPDGRWISFRRDHELYAMEVKSRKVNRLTHDGDATRWNAELDWVYPEELAIPTAHWWSPDSRRIAYLQFDLSNQMVYPHGDLLKLRPAAEPQRYPQAGTPNAKVRLGVVGAAGGKTKWLDPGMDGERLTARVTWMDATSIAVHLLSRVQDKLDVIAVDSGNGRTRALRSESAATWVNLRDDFAFLADSSKLLYGSDRGAGYRHLYIGDRALTSGEWEVTDLVCVDEKASRVFYLSTEADARERHLYAAGFDGGGKARISSEPGTHTVSMAPGCGSYLDTWSSLTEPPRKVLRDAKGRLLAELTPPDRKVTAEFRLLPNELVDFRGSDGTLFHARVVKPVDFDASRKYPAVVMVYGGPHSQTVKNQWRGADWDQALAHRGFVIWQMDGRGSAGRGHAFEKQLYRRFGKQELADQLEGVRHLLSMGFVDPARVGMYGWSYGGYMTLYSLFNAPEVFAAGVSGAPPTDWRQYDTIYTERYLGLPSENETGYRDSSVVFQAEKLRGKLMLVHNFEDDNVLFQHTLRMIDALQRAGKRFDFLLYPQKSHHVGGAVRLQMLESMTEFLERSLAAAPAK